MNKGYKCFLEQNGSSEAGFSRINPLFSTYTFSSEIGEGSTSIYELDSYASICIARHDFEYTVQDEDSIAIQQYDSIDSDRTYPAGNVLSGMHYIQRTYDKNISRFKIKKTFPPVLSGYSCCPNTMKSI